MEKLYSILSFELDAELKNLKLGHPFDKKRMAFIRNLMSAIIYMNFAELKSEDAIRILQMFNHTF